MLPASFSQQFDFHLFHPILGFSKNRISADSFLRRESDVISCVFEQVVSVEDFDGIRLVRSLNIEDTKQQTILEEDIVIYSFIMPGVEEDSHCGIGVFKWVEEQLAFRLVSAIDGIYGYFKVNKNDKRWCFNVIGNALRYPKIADEICTKNMSKKRVEEVVDYLLKEAEMV